MTDEQLVALNWLNFHDLLILDDRISVDTYDFNTYLQKKEHLVRGYCVKCEEKGCNVCPEDDTYKLLNISHAATTQDVVIATAQKEIDFSDWHDEGVMFIMEGPSNDYWELYSEVEFKGYKKRPARLWYWLHNKQERLSYPNEFKGGTYGTLFNSIIFTFKLRSAYLTNFVKCGLNNTKNNFKGISEYNYECVKTCFENYLLKEIEIIKPKVVFCFGSSVKNNLDYLYPDDYPFVVVGLPHPAGRRRGFKDDYYRHLYYSMILKGLYESNIITKEEGETKYGEFLLQ